MEKENADKYGIVRNEKPRQLYLVESMSPCLDDIYISCSYLKTIFKSKKKKKKAYFYK